MLDVAPTELLMVAVVALLIIGPKDLPRAMRIVGHWVGRARGVARQFRSGFDTMVREAELAEMEKKWAEENARIMREHPLAAPLPAPAKPVAPGDAATPADGSDAPPVMTAAPVVTPDPAPRSEAPRDEMPADPASKDRAAS